jgi:hypothetical protein
MKAAAGLSRDVGLTGFRKSFDDNVKKSSSILSEL